MHEISFRSLLNSGSKFEIASSVTPFFPFSKQNVSQSPSFIPLLQATGIQLGLVASTVVSVIGSLAVSFANSWKLTLVMLAFSPIMLIAGLFMMDQLGASTRTVEEGDAGQVKNFFDVFFFNPQFSLQKKKNKEKKHTWRYVH